MLLQSGTPFNMSRNDEKLDTENRHFLTPWYSATEREVDMGDRAVGSLQHEGQNPEGSRQENALLQMGTLSNTSKNVPYEKTHSHVNTESQSSNSATEGDEVMRDRALGSLQHGEHNPEGTGRENASFQFGTPSNPRETSHTKIHRVIWT